jgi:hypothetical protein
VGGRSVLTGQRILIGVGSIVSSVLYVASDAMELALEGCPPVNWSSRTSPRRSSRFFIVGLHSVQQPRGGWLSLLGALVYGFAFVGFPPRCSIRW